MFVVVFLTFQRILPFFYLPRKVTRPLTIKLKNSISKMTSNPSKSPTPSEYSLPPLSLSSNPNNSKLIVYGMKPNAEKDDFITAFKKYGEVVHVQFRTSHKAKTPIAFVHFKSGTDVQKISLKTHQKFIADLCENEEKKIAVRVSTSNYNSKAGSICSSRSDNVIQDDNLDKEKEPMIEQVKKTSLLKSCDDEKEKEEEEKEEKEKETEEEYENKIITSVRKNVHEITITLHCKYHNFFILPEEELDHSMAKAVYYCKKDLTEKQLYIYWLPNEIKIRGQKEFVIRVSNFLEGKLKVLYNVIKETVLVIENNYRTVFFPEGEYYHVITNTSRKYRVNITLGNDFKINGMLHFNGDKIKIYEARAEIIAFVGKISGKGEKEEKKVQIEVERLMEEIDLAKEELDRKCNEIHGLNNAMMCKNSIIENYRRKNDALEANVKILEVEKENGNIQINGLKRQIEFMDKSKKSLRNAMNIINVQNNLITLEGSGVSADNINYKILYEQEKAKNETLKFDLSLKETKIQVLSRGHNLEKTQLTQFNIDTKFLHEEIRALERTVANQKMEIFDFQNQRLKNTENKDYIARMDREFNQLVVNNNEVSEANGNNLVKCQILDNANKILKRRVTSAEEDVKDFARTKAKLEAVSFKLEHANKERKYAFDKMVEARTETNKYIEKCRKLEQDNKDYLEIIKENTLVEQERSDWS